MLTIGDVDIEVGTVITFRTLATSDNKTWSGTVEAICGYSVANLIQSVAHTHNEVKKDDIEDIIPDVKTLKFIILSTSETTSPSVKVPFAVDWIDVGTIAVAGVGLVGNLRLFNVTSDQLIAARDQLATAGYIVSITA